MSLADQLNSQKGKLKECETKVTFSDGKTYLESKTGFELQSSDSPGYVVDTKPDLRLSQIIDNLYLGSQDVAYDLDTLSKNRISHILNVAAGLLNLFEGWFIYCNIKSLDVPEFRLIDHFENCNNFIAGALSNGGRVLVHCNAGVSRSASVIIAYLMQSLQIGYVEAYNLVKEKRSFIRPNEGFVAQLKEYEVRLRRSD